MAAALIAVSTLGVPATASGSSQATNTQKALAYARCMRSHGVPRFPDPTTSGVYPKLSLQQLGVGIAQWERAQAACRRWLPNGGNGLSQSQVQQWMNGMLKFAQCMRSHGVSRWPDPVVDAGGNPEFYLNGAVDQNAPQTKAKINACLHWLPSFAISPGNPVACPGPNPGPDAGPGCGGCGCRRAQGR
ncbi:MAG: hypothetical protein ACRDLP_08425 [Solirubrobacteraceae bacterium]